MLFCTAYYHESTTRNLFLKYGEALFTSRGKQFRQKLAPGTSQPFLRAQKDRPTGVRARSFALKKVSSSSLISTVAKRRLSLPALVFNLARRPPFYRRTRYPPTLFDIHLQVFLRTFLRYIFALFSPRGPIVRTRFFYSRNSSDR